MNEVQQPQGFCHFKETVYFSPLYSWYSFYQPRKDDRLSQPWSHPVVLNTGPLDWKSSALTTRLLGCFRQSRVKLIICHPTMSWDISDQFCGYFYYKNSQKYVYPTLNEKMYYSFKK